MGLGLRPSNGTPAPITVANLEGDALGRELPCFVEWLILERWDDGAPRTLPTVSLFCEGGCFKVWLNDKDLNRACCLSGATLMGLLVSVERKLREADLEWRPVRPRGKR
jgi:hypothetical protein